MEPADIPRLFAKTKCPARRILSLALAGVGGKFKIAAGESFARQIPKQLRGVQSGAIRDSYEGRWKCDFRKLPRYFAAN